MIEISQKTIKSLRKALLGGLVVMLLAFFIIALRWGLADIYAYQAREYLETWYLGDQASLDENWQNAHDSMQTALSIFPDHPEYLDQMGQIYEWQFYQSDFNGDEFNSILQTALGFYHQATAIRPDWPHSWASVAFMKSRLGELDDEFYHALQSSLTLGANEPEVLSRLLEAVLPQWTQIPAPRHELRNIILIKNLLMNKQQSIKLAKHHQVLAFLCLHFATELGNVCDFQTNAINW